MRRDIGRSTGVYGAPGARGNERGAKRGAVGGFIPRKRTVTSLNLCCLAMSAMAAFFTVFGIVGFVM